MSKLNIDVSQKVILETLDENLEKAFSEGTSTLIPPEDVLPAMDRYTSLETAIRNTVKVVFRQVVASLIKTLNINQPLPETKFSGTIVLQKITSLGMDGYIVVQNGIVTSYTPPT